VKNVFDKLMTHSLIIHKQEKDWQGAFKDVAAYSTKGFVQYGKSLTTDQKGEEVVAGAVVFLPKDAPINSEHEHWLIDQTLPYSRKGMRVIAVNPIDDPRTGRTHHYEVAVK
jgi:hypothetical protein